ncbi:MAG: hypothetical protein KDM64_11760 [Verrucomicrobiae bacterium]|nr:hypothetical protein [Verrucomicrobiae bacterium]
MATIRIPEEAAPFLPLCRTRDILPSSTEEVVCFDTYADLMVFAASWGFSDLKGKLPTRSTTFLDRPNPIDYQIFKSDRRYPPILLIALAASGDQEVVRDEETICRMIEDFAAVGFSRLKNLISSDLPGQMHLVIAKKLAEFPLGGDDDLTI